MPHDVFDIETDIHGARVVVTRPLMSGCRSDGEIDANIDRIIAELNALRPKMKAANRLQNLKPDF
jgi:outer membrane murein-binding lipoprotein Lpp